MRIKVQDAQPRASAGAHYIEKNGVEVASTREMYLNFQFIQYPPRDPMPSNPGPQFGGDERKSIIQYFAVHEFGHVLGLAHELIRLLRGEGGYEVFGSPEQLSTCEKVMAPEDKKNMNVTTGVGYYDRLSIMHYYCADDPRPPHSPKLSCGDISIIRHIYGIKNSDKAPKCVPSFLNSVKITNINPSGISPEATIVNPIVLYGDNLQNSQPLSDWIGLGSEEVNTSRVYQPGSIQTPPPNVGTYRTNGWNLKVSITPSGQSNTIKYTLVPPLSFNLSSCTDAEVVRIVDRYYDDALLENNDHIIFTQCNREFTITEKGGMGSWHSGRYEWNERVCPSNVQALASWLTFDAIDSDCYWKNRDFKMQKTWVRWVDENGYYYSIRSPMPTRAAKPSISISKFVTAPVLLLLLQ